MHLTTCTYANKLYLNPGRFRYPLRVWDRGELFSLLFRLVL